MPRNIDTKVYKITWYPFRLLRAKYQHCPSLKTLHIALSCEHTSHKTLSLLISNKISIKSSFLRLINCIFMILVYHKTRNQRIPKTMLHITLIIAPPAEAPGLNRPSSPAHPMIPTNPMVKNVKILKRFAEGRVEG